MQRIVSTNKYSTNDAISDHVGCVKNNLFVKQRIQRIVKFTVNKTVKYSL
jgi:hypothetical protein